MDEQSPEPVAHPGANFRSFAVEAWAGHRASGWPFSRFDISSRELRVRLSFPWFASRSQRAGAIRAVVVKRRIGGLSCIRFDDAGGPLADVHVHVLYRRQHVIDELRRSGFQVLDDTVSKVRAGSWRRG
jgi:hypothetical protein